jgi:hypothetical protein
MRWSALMKKAGFGWFFVLSVVFAVGRIAWGGLALAPPVKVDPPQLLLDGEPFDSDSTVSINKGSTFTGKFYGSSVGPISVAENGNLNFSNNGSFFPTGLSDTANSNYSARIAPLWDDFLMYQPSSNRVIEQSVPGSYLAVTWENMMLFNDTFTNPIPRQTFQVVWFEAPTPIRGYNFLAHDILFGYRGSNPQTNSFGSIECSVGITNGAGLYTALPGDNNGDGYIEYFNGQNALLAWEPDTFLLFRPKSDPSMGYDASKESFLTPVPEPGSGFCVLSILASWCGFRRRRVSNQKGHSSQRMRRRIGYA